MTLPRTLERNGLLLRARRHGELCVSEFTVDAAEGEAWAQPRDGEWCLWFVDSHRFQGMGHYKTLAALHAVCPNPQVAAPGVSISAPPRPAKCPPGQYKRAQHS